MTISPKIEQTLANLLWPFALLLACVTGGITIRRVFKAWRDEV